MLGLATILSKTAPQTNCSYLSINILIAPYFITSLYANVYVPATSLNLLPTWIQHLNILSLRVLVALPHAAEAKLYYCNATITATHNMFYRYVVIVLSRNWTPRRAAVKCRYEYVHIHNLKLLEYDTFNHTWLKWNYYVFIVPVSTSNYTFIHHNIAMFMIRIQSSLHIVN